MSNKKQQQYIIKPSTTDAGNSVPPRYQPPPLPPANVGILKHPAVKDNAKQYNPKVPDNVSVKIPYPTDSAKYFPVASPGGKPYPYPYPIGIPQGRPPVRPAEEEIRTTQAQVHQVPQRNLDEPGVPQVHPGHPQQLRPQLRYPEEEFLRPDMLKFVRKPDDSARIITDQTRHMQSMVAEIRSLKEANQRLADDNQELRDLCCFLDDDRQKGRKLAREWQRFGRYTASVMRQEVSAYQTKLRELDNKQQELIKDNLELKELCLYLDEERGGNTICPSCGTTTTTNIRDDGDGSSSSTNADEPAVPQQFSANNTPRRSASRERLLHENLARQRNTFNDQIMQYVRSLEQRVKQLEDDKRALTHKINQIAATSGDASIAIPPESGVGALSGRPEAVVRALQVLEVREQLEREGRLPEIRGENMSDTTSADMDDGEKALVREMCNVVWRKLEEGPPARR